MQHRDRYSDSTSLFPTSRGTQLSVTNFWATVRKKGRRVGLDIHPHLLRNNFAKYYLIEGNGDLTTVSRIFRTCNLRDNDDKELPCLPC